MAFLEKPAIERVGIPSITQIPYMCCQNFAKEHSGRLLHRPAFSLRFLSSIHCCPIESASRIERTVILDQIVSVFLLPVEAIAVSAFFSFTHSIRESDPRGSAFDPDDC